MRDLVVATVFAASPDTGDASRQMTYCGTNLIFANVVLTHRDRLRHH
jgi:hypothetical protein